MLQRELSSCHPLALLQDIHDELSLPDQLICLPQEWVEGFASSLPLGSHSRDCKGSYRLQTIQRWITTASVKTANE